MNKLLLILLLFSSPAFATTYYVNNQTGGASDSNPGTLIAPWLTIQKCANTLLNGDTCSVGGSGAYDERVDESTAGVTYIATGTASVRAFTLGANSIIITGFTITNSGMSSDPFRSILASGDSIQILNNTITATTNDCIQVSGSSTIIQGNTLSYCAESKTIEGSVTGTKVITTGVNDKLKFKVQGGSSQTITIAAGSYSDNNALASQMNLQITGGAFNAGAYGNLVLQSSTLGPTSAIELETVATSVYTTFGFTVGTGSFYSTGTCIQVTNGSGMLVSDNTASHVADYVQSANSSNVVVRNNTFGPSDTYSPQHIDGMQTGSPGVSGLLYENNRSNSNNNADNHMGLFQDAADQKIIYRYNSTYLSAGGVDCTRVGSTTTPGLSLYNNTLVNNSAYLSSGNNQITCGSSINNTARNNIWYNSSVPNPYEGTTIDKDYDIWFAGTGNPSETHAVNANPSFTDINAGIFTLTAGSPAIDTGSALTTAVGLGSSATALTVVNAAMFQDGWAGTSADFIAVGTVSNTVQISSIDYLTNVITLANAITWSNGASVWLYKDSDGTIVLYGTAPDIGAFESNIDPTPPVPGNSGTITAASVTTTTLTLNWTAATDAITPQSALQYEICRSTSNNVTSVAQCEAATVIQAFTANIITLPVTSLTCGTTYYFNVVVRDAALNKAAYATVSQATSACGGNAPAGKLRTRKGV